MDSPHYFLRVYLTLARPRFKSKKDVLCLTYGHFKKFFVPKFYSGILSIPFKTLGSQYLCKVDGKNLKIYASRYRDRVFGRYNAAVVLRVRPNVFSVALKRKCAHTSTHRATISRPGFRAFPRSVTAPDLFFLK